jgi:hypothetical protein
MMHSCCCIYFILWCGIYFIWFGLEILFEKGFEKQIEKKEEKKCLPAGGPVNPACCLLSCSGPRNGPTSLPFSFPRLRPRGPAQHSRRAAVFSSSSLPVADRWGPLSDVSSSRYHNRAGHDFHRRLETESAK